MEGIRWNLHRRESCSLGDRKASEKDPGIRWNLLRRGPVCRDLYRRGSVCRDLHHRGFFDLSDDNSSEKTLGDRKASGPTLGDRKASGLRTTHVQLLLMAGAQCSRLTSDTPGG